jgi:hypothetical protein
MCFGVRAERFETRGVTNSHICRFGNYNTLNVVPACAVNVFEINRHIRTKTADFYAKEVPPIAK